MSGEGCSACEGHGVEGWRHPWGMWITCHVPCRKCDGAARAVLDKEEPDER